MENFQQSFLFQGNEGFRKIQLGVSSFLTLPNKVIFQLFYSFEVSFKFWKQQRENE